MKVRDILEKFDEADSVTLFDNRTAEYATSKVRDFMMSDFFQSHLECEVESLGYDSYERRLCISYTTQK